MIVNILFRKHKMLSFFLSICVLFFMFPFCKVSLAEDPRAAIVFSEEDANFIAKISEYIETLGLNPGIDHSLAGKLNAAIMSIKKGNYAAAAGQLGAFLNQIDVLQGHELTDEQVQNLRQAIQILQYPEFEFTALEFPFANPSDIEELAAFGIPNWSGSEPHNGIDLIINQDSSSIISPVMGTIMSITVAENPFSDPVGQLMIHVHIFVNYNWMVDLTIEPSTIDPFIRADQIGAITVQTGQVVEVGQHMGYLLAGDLGYPHLHYSLWSDTFNGEVLCPYQYSSDSAKDIFDQIPIIDGSVICIEP